MRETEATNAQFSLLRKSLEFFKNKFIRYSDFLYGKKINVLPSTYVRLVGLVWSRFFWLNLYFAPVFDAIFDTICDKKKAWKEATAQ